MTKRSVTEPNCKAPNRDFLSISRIYACENALTDRKLAIEGATQEFDPSKFNSQLGRVPLLQQSPDYATVGSSRDEGRKPKAEPKAKDLIHTQELQYETTGMEKDTER